MISKIDQQIAKALTDKGIATEALLQPYLDEVAKSRDSLFAVLLKKNVFTEDELLKCAADALKVQFVDLAKAQPDPAVVEKIPLKVAEYYKLVPLKLDKRRLTAAVSAPPDLRTLDDIRAQLGLEIDVCLARQKDVADAVKRFYGLGAGTIGEMLEKAPAAAAPAPEVPMETIENLDNIEKMAGDASIAKLVNQIILEAYRKRATDIHIEPYRGRVTLRYRIDGILYNANVPAETNRFILPILSRVKIMSNLNIVEKRLPQDGRAIVKVEDTQLDLRVSSIPTPYGESVVIRMLPMNRIFDLTKLGLNSEQFATFDELINKPHGVIFITGPTGSGKSTTLYACLNRINTEDRKIITIEDPIEYEMEGATQIQVQSNIGLDFARGLRSMLRHDPDVMMVGEVRDLETAEMAIRVALTGHLVFSTLHTNDAASGITRLVDIGIAPYLVASSVEAFVAQRLVRTICQACKEEDKSFAQEMKAQIARELGQSPDRLKIFKGKGCNQCNFTGFMGRLAIYEILRITEPIKRLIMQRAPVSAVNKEAMKLGMQKLRVDGWRKVAAGLTTPAEIIEATPDEELPAEAPEQPATEMPFIPAAKVEESKAAAQAEKSGFDRRQFMRLDASVTVCYRLVRPAGSALPATDEKFAEECTVTRNVSAGGLAFFIEDDIPTGSILEIRLELPQGPPIETHARLVRVTPLEGAGIREVGIQFLDLTNRDRQRIEKFVQKEKK